MSEELIRQKWSPPGATDSASLVIFSTATCPDPVSPLLRPIWISFFLFLPAIPCFPFFFSHHPCARELFSLFPPQTGSDGLYLSLCKSKKCKTISPVPFPLSLSSSFFGAPSPLESLLPNTLAFLKAPSAHRPSHARPPQFG